MKGMMVVGERATPRGNAALSSASRQKPVAASTSPPCHLGPRQPPLHILSDLFSLSSRSRGAQNQQLYCSVVVSVFPHLGCSLNTSVGCVQSTRDHNDEEQAKVQK